MSEAVDLVVVGGGPAGIAASVTAAEAGRHVVLIDEGHAVGGQIWRHRSAGALPARARDWMSRLAKCGAVVRSGTSLIDVTTSSRGFTCVSESAGRSTTTHAAHLVIATGARERFLPFPGWTLPGVIGIGAAQALVKSGVRFKGKRVVIAGSGPLLLPVAATLAREGAGVALVSEQATMRALGLFMVGLIGTPATVLDAVRYRAAFAATPYRTGTWVIAARGSGRVEEVDITDGARVRTVRCEILCAAYGLVPNTEIARHLGCELSAAGVVVSDTQETSIAGVFSAGELTGIGGVDLALVEGEIAALGCVGSRARMSDLVAQRQRLRRMAERMARTFALRAELKTLAQSTTIICRCEDVPLSSLDAGWTSRSAKLYTRAGMGACQGRVCGAALEFMYGWSPDTVRLPVTPAHLSTLGNLETGA